MEPVEHTADTVVATAPSTTAPSTGTTPPVWDRRKMFPWVSWGGVFGGLVSSIGTYILLALFGIAIGLTAITPASARPLGNVPLFADVWTSVSIVLSAFVGGYVAARMSGLGRRADGVLHGVVTWGLSTMVFAFLVTTTAGAALGGPLFGRTVPTLAGGAAVTAGPMPGTTSRAQLESMIRGTGGGGNITSRSLATLRDRLASGDRGGAIDVMVRQMGFSRARATGLVDRGMAIFGAAQNLPLQAQQAAVAIAGLSRIAWALFAAVLVSLALGIGGGMIGARGVARRRHPLQAGVRH